MAWQLRGGCLSGPSSGGCATTTTAATNDEDDGDETLVPRPRRQQRNQDRRAADDQRPVGDAGAAHGDAAQAVGIAPVQARLTRLGLKLTGGEFALALMAMSLAVLGTVAMIIRFWLKG